VVKGGKEEATVKPDNIELDSDTELARKPYISNFWKSNKPGLSEFFG
jgi:hypothetical protein